jgi:hypothetical protein
MTEIDLDVIKAERARLEAAYITKDRPATSARGIHHAALICSNVEQTIKFYQGILEFPLTELFRQPGLQGLNALLLRRGQRQPAGVFRLPRP